MTENLPTLHCSYIGGLLPWYVNGSVDSDQRHQIDSHVRSCSACSAELAAERRLAASLGERTPLPIQTPHAAWAKFVDLLDNDTNSVAAPTMPRRAATRPRLLGLVALQAAAIFALAVALYLNRSTPNAEQNYRTLSAAEPALSAELSHIRLAFDAAPTPGELRRLSQTLTAKIVSGPSTNNVVTLAMHDNAIARTSNALAWLRQQPHVLLAEPVTSEKAP